MLTTHICYRSFLTRTSILSSFTNLLVFVPEATKGAIGARLKVGVPHALVTSPTISTPFIHYVPEALPGWIVVTSLCSS